MIGLLVALTIILLAACGSNDKEGNASVDLEGLFEDIKETVKADGDGDLTGMVEGDLLEADDPMIEMIAGELDISDTDIKEGYVLASAMNINADEIILLEAKEAEAIAELEGKLEDYLEMQHNVWESYLPDQFAKVENTIIKSKGNYIIYITYEEPEKIEKVFDEAF